MKYKVTDYQSDIQEEQTGTCDLCYGTAWVENGSITVEDENGNETEIVLTVWDWGDYDTIYIDNVVNFSAWLQEREVEVISEETGLKKSTLYFYTSEKYKKRLANPQNGMCLIKIERGDETLKSCF